MIFDINCDAQVTFNSVIKKEKRKIRKYKHTKGPANGNDARAIENCCKIKETKSKNNNTSTLYYIYKLLTNVIKRKSSHDMPLLEGN